MIRYSLFVIPSILCCCKQVEEGKAIKNLPPLTLVLNGKDSIPTDSISRVIGSDIFYIQEHNNDYLVINNSYAFTQIDIYEYGKKRFFKRIKLEKEGPNGLGAPPSGLFVKSLDTMFLFFNLGQRLVSIDGEGRIIRNYGSIHNPFNSSNGHLYPYLEVSALQPLFYANGKLFFCTYEVENKQEYGGAIFDLNESKLKFPFKLPPQYRNGWWAGIVYDRYYHFYDSETGRYIRSYGNDHNLYISGSKEDIVVFAKSIYLSNELMPYSKLPGDFAREEINLYKYSALQGGYSTIKYDRWREVYYRYVIMPVSSDRYQNPSSIWSNMGILILDKNFSYRGEFKIPARYSWYQSFVSPKGLCFLDKEAFSKSEDAMVFANFSIQAGSLDDL
ncbi:MAG: DUF4221 family protein [Sediminibacterium sp.]